MRTRPGTMWITGLLFASLLVQGLYFIWTGSWSEVFVVLVAVTFSLLPYVISHYVAIKPNQTILTGIVTFVFCTLVLGEIYKFYSVFLWWDIFLHAIAGVGLGLLGYVWLYNLRQEQTIETRPVLYSVMIFCASTTILTLWEVYEFCIDQLHLSENKMQPSLNDTMVDISVGQIGVLVICVGGYLLLRNGKYSTSNNLIVES